MARMMSPFGEAIRFTDHGTPFTGETQRKTRELAADLLGNEKYVEVVIALASVASNAATTTELAKTTGIQSSMVTPVLKKLLAGGVLIELPQAHRRATHYYEVSPGPMWDAILGICEVVARQSGARPSRSRSNSAT